MEIPDRTEVKVEAKEDGPFMARVFKVIKDPYVGKVSFFRVYSGSLDAKTNFKVSPHRQNRKKSAIFLKILGSPKESTKLGKIGTGNIAAVAKVESIEIGDTLTDEGSKAIIEELKFPVPMVSRAVSPKASGDENRFSDGLRALSEEDKTFWNYRDPQTGELIITGMSDLHLEIMLKRLLNRFEVDVNWTVPKIPYKETIQGKVEQQYKHKKQSGGRGQYGEVYLRIEPLPRSGGFEFVDEIKGGVIAGGFIPAVEKGIKEAMSKGVIAGYQVDDVKVALYFGSQHNVGLFRSRL